MAGPTPRRTADPVGPVRHLDAARWTLANRMLLARTIGEFSHEGLLQPVVLEQAGRNCRAEITDPDGRVRYRFQAARYALEHWRVAHESLSKWTDDQESPVDAMAFFLEFRSVLGLGPQVLPVYLEEISSTLAARCWQLQYRRHRAATLARADFQRIEAAMSEGHPAFIANHGRVGWSVEDHRRYAPESAQPLQLQWLAVHRRRARFDAVDGLRHEALLENELGPACLETFRRRLIDSQLAPGDYLMMPVHPWQWQHKIATAFAADIACRDIVPLGPGEDLYQAQQSIRTWFNRSQPHRAYVKTALSILNMGFMRGLSAEYMEATPAINQWLHELIRGDSELAGRGFGILREIAAIGYHQPHYRAAGPGGSPYRKMLAALWRESPVPGLQGGQRLMTMAALLHHDDRGTSLLACLVRQSGLGPALWLDRYLQAWLRPLLHCFFAYGLVFMPHGENVILVLEEDAVARVLLKDIGEEIAVMDPGLPLPEAIRRIAVQVPAALQPLSIFTDVFDGFLRFMAPVMDLQLDFPEARFWGAVATVIRDYQNDHPELASRFAACDLFVEHFPRSCLNRLQLRDNRQMLDLGDPAGSLQLVGQLPNPVA